MANPTLFQSLVGRLLPVAWARNHEGAPAYERPPAHALAQYAATGCLTRTFYASDAEQLGDVLGLCNGLAPEFIARTAIFARQRGHMKDAPALLLAMLSRRDPALFDRVFDRVVDTPRMLRTFVQIVRSGTTGRKSLGSTPKRCVRRWLASRSDAAIFFGSVGTSPSIGDIVRMVHPKPESPARSALYGYLAGRTVSSEALPEIVRRYEAFKAGESRDVPDVPFQMLTAFPLGRDGWTQVARHASWQTLRMNLNTFARHGVFEVPGMTEVVAARLRDPREVRAARVFPYQLLASFRSAVDLPGEVTEAIEDAMELAIENVPAIEGRVFICPDVSGSMQSAVTGYRKGATTTIRCVDVAGLMAAAMLRKNPGAEVLPFGTEVMPVTLSASDRVLATARALAAIDGGGTSVSAPLALLNERRATGALVVIVSDNESWVDARPGRATATLDEWSRFRQRNPDARLVLIDLQPGRTTQAVERDDVLNVGGFSDQVFDIVAEFAAGRLQGGHWVERINQVAL
jgi:60 kDa SS-A/Ro ribonucleoprotein